MGDDIQRLILQMDAKINKLEKAMSKASGTVDKHSLAMERRTKRAAATMNRTFGSLAATAGSLGIYLSVDKVKRYADSWTLVQNAITATEQLTGVQLKNREELLALSERSRSDLQATTQLYTRVAASIEHLTKDEKDYARITETVAKALKLGGANAQEQAAAMLQLSQAFNKGKLDGDEFRSVAENARIITQGLADQLGVTRQAIIKMAGDGKLTVDQLVASLLRISPEVDATFAKTIPTIDQAMTKLNGRMIEYIGNLAESKGLAEAMRVAIYGLANNIELVGDTAFIAGAYILGAFGPKAIAAVGRFGVALAASTGGLTTLTGGLAAALTALSLFGDEIRPIEGELASLADYGSASLDLLIESAGEAGQVFKDNLVAAIGAVISGLTGVGVTSQQVLEAMAVFSNGVIELMKRVANFVTETFLAIPGVIGENIIDLINGIIRSIEGAINMAIGLLNKFIQAANYATQTVGVSIGTIGELDIPELENRLRDSAKRYKEAVLSGFEDGPATRLLGELNKRANEIAKARKKEETSLISPSGRPVAKAKTNSKDGKDNALDREIKNIERRIALLGLEASVVGKSALEAEKAKAAFKLLEAAKQANVPITEALREKIDGLAGTYANAHIRLQEMQDAQERAAERARELEASFEDATSSIVKGLLEGRDAADVFADALSNVADRLLDLALDDMFNTLKSGNGVGGLLGSGGLLGGAIIPGILHSGGTAGVDGYKHNRTVSSSVFNGAQKYHTGGIAGLKPDEVPAILQRGEIVLPKNFAQLAQPKSGNVAIAPVYNIDARGAGDNVEEKIKTALAENNEQLQRDLPAMINNANVRGRV